jgi:hypothetical protein
MGMKGGVRHFCDVMVVEEVGEIRLKLVSSPKLLPPTIMLVWSVIGKNIVLFATEMLHTNLSASKAIR